jgi:hypothetical protein
MALYFFECRNYEIFLHDEKCLQDFHEKENANEILENDVNLWLEEKTVFSFSRLINFIFLVLYFVEGVAFGVSGANVMLAYGFFTEGSFKGFEIFFTLKVYLVFAILLFIFIRLLIGLIGWTTNPVCKFWSEPSKSRDSRISRLKIKLPILRSERIYLQSNLTGGGGGNGACSGEAKALEKEEKCKLKLDAERKSRDEISKKFKQNKEKIHGFIFKPICLGLAFSLLLFLATKDPTESDALRVDIVEETDKKQGSKDASSEIIESVSVHILEAMIKNFDKELIEALKEIQKLEAINKKANDSKKSLNR